MVEGPIEIPIDSLLDAVNSDKVQSLHNIIGDGTLTIHEATFTAAFFLGEVLGNACESAEQFHFNSIGVHDFVKLIAGEILKEKTKDANTQHRSS